MAETTPKAPTVKKAPAKTTKPSTATADSKVEVKKAAAPAKAAPKKAAPATPAEKPAAAKKAPAPRKPAAKKAPTAVNTVSDEQRYRMIAEAAYFRAESGQFKGDPVRDWIEAERDIAILLSDTK